MVRVDMDRLVNDFKNNLLSLDPYRESQQIHDTADGTGAGRKVLGIAHGATPNGTSDGS